MKSKIAAIVNEDNILKKSSSSLFNFFILGLILLAFVQIILEGDADTASYLAPFWWMNELIIFIFSVEYILRFWTADVLDTRYKGWRGRLRYFFSFYALIDLLAILPYYISLLLGIPLSGVFKILRLLRLFRFISYLRSFSFISKAIQQKKSELLISLSLVIVMLIIASTFMYYIEHEQQPEKFSSILSTMWWGVATLTTVGYGDIYPETAMGKLLGGIIAILGVGLFALPAGIIASGFVEAIEQDKKEKELKEKASMIQLAFQRVQQNSLLGFKVKRRFLTLPYLKARLNYTEADIFEVVRNSENLRIKWEKSSADLINADMLVLEHFSPNCSYGEKHLRDSTISIVNPIGRGERAFSHFSKTLAQYGKFSVFSNEYYSSGDILPKHKFQFDINKAYSKEQVEGPEAYLDFCSDLSKISKDSWVIVLRSASSSRNYDLHLLFGGKKGDISFETIEKPTVRDSGRLSLLIRKLQEDFSEEGYKIGTHEEFKCTSPNLLHQYIHKHSHANVLTIFININILTQENKAYYRFIKKLADALNEVLR